MILGEDEGFLALDKPAGIPVFPPHADPAGPCVLHALFEARPEQAEPAWPEGYSGGILHRLDTWTSGLLLVARTLPALEAGRAAFVGQQLSKTYRFLCDRVVGWTEHRVDRPLAHDKSDRRKMCWQRGRNTPHRGRWLPAVTEFESRGELGGFALWEARMQTGVMHQIRLHAASVGLPLLGDRLYGGSADPQGQGRFYLHHCGIDGWMEPIPSVAVPESWSVGPAALRHPSTPKGGR